MSSRGSFRRGLGFGTLSFGSVAIVGLVSTIVTARLYGASVIGEFALAAATVMIVGGVSSAREQAALVRALAALEPRAERVTALFALVFGFSFLLTVAVAAVAVPVIYLVFTGPLHHPGLVGPVLVNLLGYLIFTNSAWNIDFVLSAFRAGRELFWIRLVQNLGFLVAVVGLSYVERSVWMLIAALIASSALGLAQRVWVVRRYMRLAVPRHRVREALPELPEMLRFGVRLVPVGVADGVSDNIGVYLLAGVGSTATVGGYDRANRFAQRFSELNFRIDEMLFPTLLERRALGDHEGYDRALVDTMRYVSAGVMMVAAAGGGAAVSIMSLYGPAFERYASVLAVLLLVPALGTMAGIQRQSAFAENRPGSASLIAVGRMLVTIAATVPLSRWRGAEGVALGLLVGLVIDTAAFLRLVRRYLTQPIHRLWTVRQLLALVVAYACGFAAARAVDDHVPGVAGLLLSLTVGILTYAGVFALVGGLNHRDRERIGELVDAARLRLLR